MHKVIYLSLITMVTMGILQSCKKGENDPFLSMRTRKARISGEWKLSSAEFKTSATSDNSTYTTSTTSDGTARIVTTTITNNGITTTDTYTSDYTLDLEIEKNGTYKMTEIEDGSTTTTTGTWIFLKRSKEDELKNKEAILLTKSSHSAPGTSSTTTDINGQVYTIEQLKNKEMIWTADYSYSNNNGSETGTSKMTFKQD